MLCESIRPLIRTFLDDLLDEKDYQNIQAHLSGCERCRSYASSLGTLSYRLYELGQVAIPPDMISMILYGLEKKRQADSTAPAALPDEKSPAADLAAVLTKIFWAVIFLILVVSVVAVAMIMDLRRHHEEERLERDRPVSVPVSRSSEPVEPAVPSDGENLE